jgi:hypothetical protein
VLERVHDQEIELYEGDPPPATASSAAAWGDQAADRPILRLLPNRKRQQEAATAASIQAKTALPSLTRNGLSLADRLA